MYSFSAALLHAAEGGQCRPLFLYYNIAFLL